MHEIWSDHRERKRDGVNSQRELVPVLYVLVRAIPWEGATAYGVFTSLTGAQKARDSLLGRPGTLTQETDYEIIPMSQNFIYEKGIAL